MSSPSERPSKSEQKRRAQALQSLGQRLAELKPEALAGIPISEHLANALIEAARITSNSATKRHRQYIGRLMRDEDVDAIEAALARFDAESAAATGNFHDIERWRDDLISGARSVNDYSAAYPRADRSQLRTLTQRARTANDAAMRKKHARALFRWLRDNQETA